MPSPSEKYTMRISRLTIDKLGIQMYDRVSAVLAELLMNSAIPSEGSMRTSCPALRNGHCTKRPQYHYTPLHPSSAAGLSLILRMDRSTSAMIAS